MSLTSPAIAGAQWRSAPVIETEVSGTHSVKSRRLTLGHRLAGFKNQQQRAGASLFGKVSATQALRTTKLFLKGIIQAA